MRAYERLLHYVTYATTSDETEEKCPSSEEQLVFAQALEKELFTLGIREAEVDVHGYLYATLPATPGKEQEKVIGLIAHMDTAPAFSGTDIHPQLVENYDGEEIFLNAKEKIVMRPSEFEHLKDYKGQTLIVTDGTTLLGADDKAGIAEILTMAETLIEEKIPHGTIKIAFTPDEEIGRGADLFDVDKFSADYAYTVDGGKLGEIEYENFNAASAVVKIHGVNIHPGEGKNKMKNASLLAMEFQSMLPAWETPAHTQDYEGFYHLQGMQGDESEAELSYIIRDHSMEKFESKKKFLQTIQKYLNQKYGKNTVELFLEDSYYNMKEKILPHMEIVEKAKKAMEECGVTPVIQPIRGGTDGARLSFMGLPCPNLSTGGHNFHGKYEYIPVESMDKMVEILIKIVKS